MQNRSNCVCLTNKARNNEEFDWEGDRRIDRPYHQTIIYEAHVKGFSKLNNQVPEELRGTYSGLAHPASIEYLKNLGITAVELLPVHYFVADRHLVEKGLTNYWGYNTLAFFVPDARYCSSSDPCEQVNEFKYMVRELHKAGIEVILDVVYNHTAEGNHMGPTLSFKRLDNASYYRLVEDDQRHIIHQDPVISQVKLIAEPWDINEDGYMVGKFPVGWGEWNGIYRDQMRDFWRGQEVKMTAFAQRFTGSPDLYHNSYRRPTASINFITADDGFTLRDLVSYNDKHNEANGDNNEDGDESNHSWNCGVEGPTDDAGINALRARQQRNFLVSLFLSQGVTMLMAGDEWGRSQRRRWFQDMPVQGSAVKDIMWFLPDGNTIPDEDWADANSGAFGVFLNGLGIRCVNMDGQKLVDDNFYIIFNPSENPVGFRLPAEECGSGWRVVIDTTEGLVGEKPERLAASEEIQVGDRSVVVLSCPHK